MNTTFTKAETFQKHNRMCMYFHMLVMCVVLKQT